MFRRSVALPAAAFAALAALVATGAFAGLDQWAVDHLMPGASFGHEEGGFLEGLIPLYHSQWDTALGAAANVVTLPAAFLVACAIVLARSRPLMVVLLATVAVEVLCKAVLVRPALYDGGVHIGAFDSSFPSGHALRTVLVVVAVGRPWAAAWAVVSIVLVEVAGWHTPTDLAGGVLLALLGAGAARALRRRRLAARRA